MKIHQGGWVHRMMQGLSARASKSGKSLKMLEVAIDNAYEGLIITDAEGVILKVNQAYADFLGKKMDEMVGRHVTEVVENTRMHIVARIGEPEIAHIQKINGHEMICSRIPIFEYGKVVAVVGKVMFQDVNDMFVMIDRFRKLKAELEFYKSELNKRLGAKYSKSRSLAARWPGLIPRCYWRGRAAPARRCSPMPSTSRVTVSWDRSSKSTVPPSLRIFSNPNCSGTRMVPLPGRR